MPAIVGKALVAVGTITYSMYLCHYMVFMMLFRMEWIPVFEDMSWLASGFLATTLVIFPVVLLVSTVSYWAIERPFLSYRGRYKEADA